MTREEAIEVLQRTVAFSEETDFVEAKRMAIEALSALQTDLISRAGAIRWVKTECNPYGKPTLDYDSGIKVIEHLKKMPSELPPADAVEVVRCKDCKWSVKAILDEYCVECTMYHTSCMNHGYCHHGERKNDSE